MIILGATAPLSWNNAAVLVKDGKLIAACEEERFTRVKHSPRQPPYESTKFCLEFAQLRPHQIDVVAFGYRSPFDAYGRSILENLRNENFNRLIREAGAFAEYYVGLRRYREWLENIGVNFTKTKVIFVPHHIAHAASAFYCSGFESSAILSLDGQGEDDAGFLGYGDEKGNIHCVQSIKHHQSLGWVYGDATSLLGFKSHSDEGKVMALASFGKKIINLSDYFEVHRDDYILHKSWYKKLWRNIKKRKPSDPIEVKHKNFAKSVQTFLEQAGQATATKLYEKTGLRNISLAGGVALNCDMNSAIKHLDFIDSIFIQPASNDAGCALGAALETAHQMGESDRFKLTHAYWGPEYSDTEIEYVLKESRASYKKVLKIEEVVSDYLVQGSVVGWFQGRCEWGPRALGNRSILAHPGRRGIKDTINKHIKHREMWRPFAPSILHEYGDEYFDDYIYSPFMLLTFNAKNKAKIDLSQTIHVDGTSRLQSVTKDTNKKYYALIEAFRKKTGIPAILNTSFNDAGEPIVLSPKDALRTFYGTGLDMLAIGSFIVVK